MLVFNGTVVESGCRFNVSTLDGNDRKSEDPASRCLTPLGLVASPSDVLSATVDLVDFLCLNQRLKQDIPLSTAVLLSARFPFVSPSAHMKQCERAGVPEPRPEAYVVDGGYLENSGAASALDLWNGLAPMIANHNRDDASRACIVPFFIQIDNGYGEPPGPGKVPPIPQFRVPVATLTAAGNGRTAGARQAAQLLFHREYTTGGVSVTIGKNGPPLESRYAHFSLLAHPGARAPLGWTLSGRSFEDLEEQFDLKNAEATDQVKTWFSNLLCTLPE